ncbi:MULTISPECIES: GNAT family N-acetyltransferase [Actinomadura]|uniref:Enhanced intracellular survival protein Eis n=1 Tax=Actinomadura yumaensis TaxID=111807 RepID=A0ABW2CQZ4_9ACTN|nr:GNAT family N-acetyltransferase [Actinomadura sp. J1-007]MWK39037.1 GNAT family N-acetyltransferase [Actinomadura sp. J1-007]
MEIRALTTTEEFEATRDIRSRAFGPLADDEWAARVGAARENLDKRRYFAGYEDGRVVAVAHLHDMDQWWNGRPVSMGGVSGVTVAPEARGRGVGGALMRYVLERCAGFGHAVSMLYPATTALYRSLGWEHAGAQNWLDLSASDLRDLRAGDPVRVRRAGPDDAAEVVSVLRRVHEAARDSGPIDRREQRWRFELGQPDLYYYLAEDGFLAYRWGQGNEVLRVERLVAGSEATYRALWGIVGSGSTIARTVRACVSPYDPVLWLLRDRDDEDVARHQWMLRVVDAPAAIAARGYPAGLSAEVPLVVEDALLPDNSGAWRLIVKDGEGRLERATSEDAGAVRVGIRGLSALYAGLPASTLSRSGLAAGDAGALHALSAAFAAAPFSLDYF